MESDSDREITRLIARWQHGDRTAEGLLYDCLYKKLRSLAAQCLVNEKNAASLTPTALVHEAYIRLMRSKQLKIKERGHFLALISRVMRRIVVDRARAIAAARRGGAPQRVDLTEAMIFTDEKVDEILALNNALEQLAKSRPREASLVELRFFAGFSLDEAATALGVSERTARRDWEVARVYLKDAIDGAGDSAAIVS